ncbi:hypothetical protein [Paraburkholderia nodosa]|nr:hypothetical protein [Paraburkholderia nodosa]
MAGERPKTVVTVAQARMTVTGCAFCIKRAREIILALDRPGLVGQDLPLA